MIKVREISYKKLRNIVRTRLFPLFNEYETWKYMDNVFYEVRVDGVLAAISSCSKSVDDKILYLSLTEVRKPFRNRGIHLLLLQKRLQCILHGWKVYVVCSSEYSYSNIVKFVNKYTHFTWVVRKNFV